MNSLNLSFPQELAPLRMISVEEGTATSTPPEALATDHDTLNIVGVGGLVAVTALIYAGVKVLKDSPKPDAETDAKTPNDYLGNRKR